MLREELVFVATCDISGHVRGKGFPASELPSRLAKGVGWTHSNIMMSAFGPIFDTPFGTAGDLMIVPDRAAEIRVDFGDGTPAEHFFLGDFRNTDGTYWECCPRNFLRRALAALDQVAGPAHGRGLRAGIHLYRQRGPARRRLCARRVPPRRGAFGTRFVAALRAAGLEPDSFLAEYGPRQFEVTVGPRPALRAADQAIITREMARATALPARHARDLLAEARPRGRRQRRAYPYELPHAPAAQPATHAPKQRLGLSEPAQHFFAGVLHHLPAISAITAPSPVSYLRLVPNRWAPTTIDIVQQDRGAALRVCPVFAASGAARARRAIQRRVPRDGRDREPLSRARRDRLRRRGRAFAASWNCPSPAPTRRACRARSRSALDNLQASDDGAPNGSGPVHLEAYLRHKRAELAHVAGLSAAELCAKYAEVY